MSPFSLVVLLLGVSVVSAQSPPNLILPPIKTGVNASLILLPGGGDLSPSDYEPLAKQIQIASPLSLWVGLVYIDVNAGFDVTGPLNQIVSQMRGMGMTTNKIFYGGHSFGTVLIQNYCYQYAQNCTGMVLLAGNLVRNSSAIAPYPKPYFYNRGYPVNTLTVGAELDGLTRVTRMMEGYYHQVARSTPQIADDFPVVVILGANHMQYCSEDTPAEGNHKMDFVAEISYDQAHEEFGDVIGNWLSAQLSGKASSIVESYLQKTQIFLDPLLNAFDMESYYFFETPCYEKYPNAVDADSCCHQGGGCRCNNKWSALSMQFMSGLNEISVDDKDVMHPVNQVPVHLPQINNTCSAPNSNCVLLTDSVTENIYNPNITTDDPIYPLGAVEMRTKLKARQALQAAAGVPNPDFETLDGPSRCADLNQWTFQWALESSGAHSRSRYLKLGQRLVFGEDQMEVGGYFWINTPMLYTPTTIDGQQVIVINSTGLATPTDYWQSNSRGMHYCKVLSPAWAMEWIYVDGLRLNDSLDSQPPKKHF